MTRSRYVDVRLTGKEAQAILDLKAWVEWRAGGPTERAQDRALAKVRAALAVLK
jgi:hypothetical protein